MDAKSYLEQVKLLDKRIENKKSEISKLHNMASSLGGIGNEERVQTSKRKDAMAELVSRIVDEERELSELAAGLIKLRKEVVATIEKTDNADIYDVLYQRYIQHESWDNVAYNMQISKQHMYRLHKKGLRQVEKIIKMRANESKRE